MGFLRAILFFGTFIKISKAERNSIEVVSYLDKLLVEIEVQSSKGVQVLKVI